MHHSLDLRNLSNIKSTRIRRVANAVAAGSKIDLRVLNAVTEIIPPTEAVFVLPALFVNIDSARIPDPSTLDSLLSSSSHIPSLLLAFESIRAITRLAVIHVLPVDAFQDLWPHIWNWLDFIHSYWDCLPMLGDRTSQVKAMVGHSVIIRALDKDENTSKNIRSTPGVRRLLAAAWKEKISGNIQYGSDPTHGPFLSIVELLTIITDGKDDKSNFDEILEGVGGNITDLTSTMVQHLASVPHFTSRWNNPSHVATAAYAGSCYNIWAGDFEIRCRLQTTLQSVGYIPELLTTICRFHGTPAVEAMNMFLFELGMALRTISDIVLAFRSGLLRVVITIGASMTPVDKDATDFRGRIYKKIAEMLETFLPWSLMHYTVLAQLKQCFLDTMEFAADSMIHTSPLRTQWENLSALMRARLQFFDFWEAHGRPSFAACDNRKASPFAETIPQFLTSASVDWRAEHRAMCQRLRYSTRTPLLLLAYNPSPLPETFETINTRGGSFLRALLTDDYKRQMADVWLRQILFLYEHPGEEFVTFFRHSVSQDVEIRVRGRNTLDREIWTRLWGLESAFERTAQRKGLMDLHIITIFTEARQGEYILLPMRTDTTELYDRLVRAAQLLPSGMTRADSLPLIQDAVMSLVGEVDLNRMVLIH
ncbi:hypothetical protein DFH06DRAFT_1397406 [Mycena polygramma]|nr:hypothetical protein DFH06DRAFT_1397406 [Mycena polygramma]